MTRLAAPAAYEVLALVYFGLMALAWRARPAVLGAAGGMAALAALAATAAPPAIRAWLPHLYLVAGYWIPALAVRQVPRERSGRFERWLVRSDDWIRPRLPSLPGGVATVCEAAYLMCYPLVPLSFAVVWWRGAAGDVTRFWFPVLLAGYACYGTLPWLLSRPPRALPPAAATTRLRALNAFVLGRVSHQWNTFPSGHVAVSCAAAWGAWHVMPVAGAALGAIAAGVAIGAAAGRYHYVIDVAAGVVVFAGAAMITWGAAWI
jgi:hypothetical protein